MSDLRELIQARLDNIDKLRETAPQRKEERAKAERIRAGNERLAFLRTEIPRMRVELENFERQFDTENQRDPFGLLTAVLIGKVMFYRRGLSAAIRDAEVSAIVFPELADAFLALVTTPTATSEQEQSP